MNINPIVKSALSSLNLPVEPNAYDGEGNYIVFNYADERPSFSADDEDIYDSTVIQVHYFTRENPQANKKAIRRLLRLSGFKITSTSEIYENDTKYTHVIVEAEIDGDIED